MASQRLLTPAVVELPPELLPVLDAHADALGAMGYEVDAFGGGSTRVAAVPAVLGTRDPGPALERILRDLERVTWRIALAAVLIVAGVALVMRGAGG